MILRAIAIAALTFAAALSAQTTDVSLLTCSPSRLLPRETAACTVALTKPAPPGGTEILLSSTNPSLLSSAASLTIPSGAISATFTVTAATFSSDETAALAATALHSVFLSWAASDSPNLSYYNLYRGIVSGGPYTVVTAAGLVTTYTDSNVQPGQTYYYVVTAVDATGAESTYSNEASAALPAAAPQTAALSLCASTRTTGITLPLRCGAPPPATPSPARE